MSSIDVIVPCYRYAHFLPECVESVLAQNVENLRVLIVDDASPDNTAEVAAALAQKDSRVNYLRHITNKGHIATYNDGIEWVSAKYLLLLSADDYLLPGALNRSISLMEEHPGIGFTFGRALSLDETGAFGPKIPVGPNPGARVLPGLEFMELSKSRNPVTTPTAVVRTELQKRVGGYRPELPHSGDLEMWLRLAAYSSVGMLEAYQAIYRHHSSNMSRVQTANLADVEQREAALDCFFQTCHDVLPNPQRMRQRFFWALACDTVGYASEAFNDGEMVTSDLLLKFALRVCPQVERSLPWAGFAIKRRLGAGVWRALRPATAGLRQIAALLRRRFGH